MLFDLQGAAVLAPALTIPPLLATLQTVLESLLVGLLVSWLIVRRS